MSAIGQKQTLIDGSIRMTSGTMKPTPAQHEAFLAQELLPGVTFRHNEFVTVVAGEHQGSSGSLVSVEVLGDDPVFLLELERGFDVRVRQSELVRR